ncbi:phage portal protein [Gemmata sp. SH-PL17]|uniref:phage portal protein n=1 Tax=Gemmata sp. SH-PL17 TaxID=1630693 RepID=UPI0013903F7F|nr:phage portal protein [Gemmata sp. SH-PL17]
MLLNRLLRARMNPGTTGPNRNSPRATAGSAANGWWQPFVKAGLVSLAEDADPSSGEAALAYHAWYRAISLIAQKVAAVPKHLYRRTESDAGEGKERARDHTVYRLVHERANSEQTAFQFWLQMAGHVPSRGNAYAAIWREGGSIKELIPMDPDRTYPCRRNGQLWYVVFPFESEGEGIRLRPEEVLHFKGFGFDGLVGYPVWAKAAQEIGLALGQRKLESSLNKNSGRPAMLLETDQAIDDKVKTRLRDDWERMHVGLDNAGRTAILDRGLKAKAVSLNAEQLGAAGAAQMSLVAIANFTGVPASKLGAGGRNYASQEQEDTAFVADGLDFYLNVLEDEASAKLLSDPERAQGYEVKANREALLRPAIKEKFETLRVATAGKPFMTQNEARKQLDLPPSDEGDADKLLIPLNMGQGGNRNSPNDNADPGPGRPEGSANARAPKPDPAVRAAAATALKTSAKKLVKRVAFHANRAARDGAKFMAFLDGLRAQHATVFRAELLAAEEMATAANGNGKSLKGQGADWLFETIAAEYATVSNEATPKTLAASVAALVADQEVRLPKDLAHILLESPNEA